MSGRRQALAATGAAGGLSLPVIGQSIAAHTYGLSEHDLYGSSRIGIKGYYPLQVGFSWRSGMGYSDTERLWRRQPWYSLEYQDLIRLDSLSPRYRQSFDLW